MSGRGCFLIGFLLLQVGCTGLSKSVSTAPQELEFVVAAADAQNLLIQKFEIEEAQFFEGARRKLKALQDRIQPKVDPYFGAREVSETCRTENLQALGEIQSELQRAQVSGFFATENQVIGACSQALDTKKVQLLWLYCRQKQLGFEIRYFYPHDQAWMEHAVAQCRPQ